MCKLQKIQFCVVAEYQSKLNQIYSESISHIEKDLIILRKEVDMLLDFKSAAIMDDG